MKLNLDCIPCFQKQALQAVHFISDDEKLNQKMLREVTKELLESDWESTPPELAQSSQYSKEDQNENDPYKEVKKENNDFVLKKYHELKDTIKNSWDPLKTAVRLAITGNIIDFGVVQDFDLERTIRELLKKQFAINDYEQLKETLKNAKTLLFFC